MEKSEENPPWQIVSRHYTGGAERIWPARLIRTEATLQVFAATFPATVRHPHLGLLERGTASLEYFWQDRWYNIFRLAQPSGALRNYYCNITLPPVYEPRRLIYTDLELDLLVALDGSWQILDEDEFTEAAHRYGYSAFLQTQARATLHELVTMVQQRLFPFTDLP